MHPPSFDRGCIVIYIGHPYRVTHLYGVTHPFIRECAAADVFFYHSSFHDAGNKNNKNKNQINKQIYTYIYIYVYTHVYM